MTLSKKRKGKKSAPRGDVIVLRGAPGEVAHTVAPERLRRALDLLGGMELLLGEGPRSEAARAYVRAVAATASLDLPLAESLQRIVRLMQEWDFLPRPAGPKPVPNPRSAPKR